MNKAFESVTSFVTDITSLLQGLVMSVTNEVTLSKALFIC